MGGLTVWLHHFRDLHERARKGALTKSEEANYLTLREELARAMIAAQKLTLQPGQLPRRALRVARALQLDIEVGGMNQRTLTLDLSPGGFSALLARPPALGELVSVTLRLPAAESLACRARITEVKPSGGPVRVGAQYIDLPAADRERLEMFIIDTVLALFTT